MGSLLDQAPMPDLDTQFSDEFADDFAEELEHDPPSAAVAPVTAAPVGKRLGAKMAPAGPTVSPAMRRRIAAELQLYIELVAGIGELKCGECAKAVEDHAKKVAERGANIIGRYPDMAEKFIRTGLIADLLGLAGALKPVASQIIGHHITHTIGGDHEGDHGDELDAYGPYRPGA